MIIGRVNSKREAVIALAIFNSQGEPQTVEAVIDTGYSSYLSLPAKMIATLGLPSIGTEQLTLADGSEITSVLCAAQIVWDSQTYTIQVDTLETEVLIGMALLEGFELNIRVTEGGPVTLVALTSSAS